MAHRLLHFHRMLPVTVCALLMLLSSACVLPLQFEEERDGGGLDDHPPAILLDTAVPSMLTIATIEQSAPRKFTVQVEDEDAGDTLYLRVFRNYHVPPVAPAVTDREISKPDDGSQTVRTFEIDSNTWCQGAPTDKQLTFEVLVSDKKFLDLSVEPLFRAVPPGAKTARGYWIGVCQP